MKFAFYGRVSTEDQQDPTVSKQWQMCAGRVDHRPAGGAIVAEFFDIGQSRSLPWKRRPEALGCWTPSSDPTAGSRPSSSVSLPGPSTATSSA